MNERIQELAYQAEDWAIAHEAEHGSAYFQAEYTRKFAELIVKECAEVSENYAGGSMPLSIAYAIKEHFGVEQ